jgi:sec-independent protein translocase protein TatC
LLFFVGAAMLTPPDVVTQIMMALPLMLLYEVSIWSAVVFARRRLETDEDQPADALDPQA